MIRGGIRRAFGLALRRRDRWEQDVEDEIKLHLALRAEQLAARGAAPDDAYAEAVRRFGPLDESRARLLDAARHRETTMQRAEFFNDVRQDVSFALRTLGRQKAWTAITIATLALGIGATTAMFSVVSSLMLHALPYPHADRIVLMEQEPTQGNSTGMRVTVSAPPPVVHAWRTGSHSFEAVEPYRSSVAMMRTSGEPAQLMGAWILPSFPTFAGVRPLIGRMFSADETAAAAHVVMLSEDSWRTRFGGDSAVLGRAITLNDSLYSIIGVLPATLRLPRLGGLPTDLWMPLDVRDRRLGINAVARLRAGLRVSVVEKELDSIADRSGVYETGNLPFRSKLARPSQMVSFHDSLILLTAAVALVLLVACANVAHLLLARASARERELAIRAALGAGRTRLFRQLLTESLVLAVAGAAAGMLLGWAGLRILISLRPSGIAELADAHLDATTLIVVCGIAVASGVLFGVLGTFQAFRRSTHDSLKSGALASSHARAHDRLRSLLVVSEMALSATLLVGATLLVRSVVNMQRTNLGYDPAGLYGVGLQLPKSRYATPAARSAFVAELEARIRALPGIRGLAVTSVGPGERSFNIGALEIEGETPPPTGTTAFIDGNGVQPEFFRTMRIPIVEGGTFSDTSETSTEVIVNEGFARRHWARGAATGHRLRIAFQGQGTWLTIVGVAGDAMLSGPVTETSAPILYSPYSGRTPTIYVRTEGTADPVAPIRALLVKMDPRMPSRGIVSVAKMVDGSIAEPRFTMIVLTSFTALALVLAGIGLYGVMSYGVAQRTREIGIRIALGAPGASIARLVVARGVGLAIVGAAIGLAGAYWGTRLISTMLFGVARLDAASFAIGGVVLLGAAAAACAIPTRRAVAVDPIEAIRGE